MKKTAGKIAMILVLVMLANNFAGCTLLVPAIAGVFTDNLRPFRIAGIVLDVITLGSLVWALTPRRSEASNETGIHLASVEHNPLAEYYSAMEVMNTLPEAERAALMEKINSLPVAKRDSLVRTVTTLPQAELAASMERLNALSDAELVSAVQDFNSLSEAELDSIFSQFGQFWTVPVL